MTISSRQKIILLAGINVLLWWLYMFILVFIDPRMDDKKLTAIEMNLIEKFFLLEVILVMFVTLFIAIGTARRQGTNTDILLMIFFWPYSFYYLYKSYQ
jgi:hypothetical protein